LFPGHSEAFLDAEATEERAKSIGKQVRYLHFATHGLLDERFPLNSALVLTIPDKLEEGHDNGLLQGERLSKPPVIPRDLMLKLVHERKAGGSSGTVAQPCGSGSIGRRVRSERAHATGVLCKARVVIGNA